MQFNFHRAILTALLLASLGISAFAQAKTIVPSGRSTVEEETIAADVVLKEIGLFSTTEVKARISGVLWTPASQSSFPRPYPVVILSHGSQDTGANLQVQPFGLPAFFLGQGVAVFAPIRKGFSRRGAASSTFNVDHAEPVDCRSFPIMERGLASAKSDTIELLSRLKDRPELDLTRVILAGQSRGGFLSLALAADGLPGVIGVMNFSGGWHGEPCPGGGSFNQAKYGEFGNKISVPILSFYGDSDNYYSAGYIRTFLKLLDKPGGKNYGVILPGYSHVRPMGDVQVWGEKAAELLK